MDQDDTGYTITNQEVTLLIEGLDLKINLHMVELQRCKEASALYYRNNVKDVTGMIASYSTNHAKYLIGEIDRNMNLIKKLLRSQA